MNTHRGTLFTTLCLAGLAHLGCGNQAVTTKEPTATPAKVDAATFIRQQTALLTPLDKAASLGWWNASVSGSKADFARSTQAMDAFNRYLADPHRFATVVALRKTKVTDPLVRRQLDVLYLQMLGKQVAPDALARITALQNKVEQAFNTYRAQLDGKRLSDSQIQKILNTSTSSAKVKAAWQAQKAVGAAVAPTLIELVELRNEVARKLGFRDYYAMRLAEDELDEAKLLALFDELDRLTRKPFTAAKAEVDRRLAKRFGISTDALMPWHYQNPFFQEPPNVFKTGLDAVYRKQDTLAVCRKFYRSIGLKVDAILKRSDLYEKPGKSPHAFTADIDRNGDIRVLANIVPGLQWQQTMIHELGHAVYDEYLDPKLPWMLRSATHALTTEGLAMMLDRVVANPLWAEKLGLIDDAARKKAAPEAAAYLAFASLQFSRWTQVMLRFERALYADPHQNLNKLWWDLVEKYQGLERPPGRNAPDYASKIHLVVSPVYYHSYMLGELFAAQVHEAIAKVVGVPPAELVYVGEPKVGAFLRERLFAPGARYPWNELVERITGKPLSPAAFARRFSH